MMILLLEALCCKENLFFFSFLPAAYIQLSFFLLFSLYCLVPPIFWCLLSCSHSYSSLSFFPHLSLWKPRGQSMEFFSYQEEGLLRRGSGQGLAAKIRREGSCLSLQNPGAAWWRALPLINESFSPEKLLGLPSKESSETAMWPTHSCQRDNTWKGFNVFSIQEYFAS